MANTSVKFKDYIPHELVAFESLFQFTEEQPQEVQAMKAIHDPDTLYFWEAMKEPYADKFLEAMHKKLMTLQTANIGNY
jgi:hypothetical protein